MPRYNKDPNPYAATGTAGYLAGGTSGSTAGRVASLTGMDRGTGYQVVNGNSAGQAFIYAGRLAVPAAPGQTWSGTPQVRCSAAVTVQYFVVWTDSAGSQLGAGVGSSFAVAAGVPVRLRDVAQTAPANTTNACGAIIVPALPASATLLVTAHRLEQINDPNLGYGDGNSDRWAWDGTAGASTSTRAADDGDEWWALLAG